MSPEEWHRRWVGVLTLSDYDKNQAESAFDLVFKDSHPDLKTDPADNALNYVIATRRDQLHSNQSVQLRTSKMLRPILVVEDNPNDLELTLFGLMRCNLANEIAVVRDGHEAMEYLERQGQFSERAEGNPQFVLLDVKLPKLTGLEVLERMRESETLKHVPVIMLTSSKEHRDVLRSYDRGANAYVVKPMEFSDFVTAINDMGMFWGVLNQTPPANG